MKDGSIHLSSGFPPRAEADWHAAVRRSGTGELLSGASDDGVPIAPLLARRGDTSPVLGASAGKPWAVIQRVDAGDAASASESAQTELAGGADGVVLAFAGSAHPLGGQIPPHAARRIAGDIGTSDARLLIDAGTGSIDLAAPFLSRIAAVDLMLDPVAAFARGDGDAGSVPALVGRAADLLMELETRGLDGRVAMADGRLWHAAGASEAQELAAALATVVALLRAFDERQVASTTAARRIGVALAADSAQFLTIAKFRAMRLLLARIGEEVGIDATIPIHAETAWRMMSRREPRMNVLRATGAAVAAAIGGADSITVLPFDALDGTRSPGARRLARNTQLIAAQESQLYRFADPAAGSGAIEALTDGLTEKAWARFAAMEVAGGIVSEVASGTFMGEVAAMRDARIDRVAAGDIEMVGANVFRAPDADPEPPPPTPPSPETELAYRRLAETVEVSS